MKHMGIQTRVHLAHFVQAEQLSSKNVTVGKRRTISLVLSIRFSINTIKRPFRNENISTIVNL
jgi:hypothetical protein